MDSKKSDLVEIGALWYLESGKGLKGKFKPDAVAAISAIQGGSVLVLKNQYKEEGDKKPDYRLFIAPPNGREPGSDG